MKIKESLENCAVGGDRRDINAKSNVCLGRDPEAGRGLQGENCEIQIKSAIYVIVFV